MKKIISVLLAMLMIFSAMSVMASAVSVKDGINLISEKDEADKEEAPEEEEPTEEKAKLEIPLFKDLKGKVTLPEFAIKDFGSAALYVVLFPLFALIQGLLIIVFTVLDILDLDLSDLGISF